MAASNPDPKETTQSSIFNTHFCFNFVGTPEKIPITDSSDSDSELEDYLQPYRLLIANMKPGTTHKQIRAFFGATANVSYIKVRVEPDREGREMLRGFVQLSSHQETRDAVELKGEPLNGVPVFLARLCNSRVVLLVSGFKRGLRESTLRLLLEEKFDGCGTMSEMFLPKDSQTSLCLSFAYLFMDQEGRKAEQKHLTLMGGRTIEVEDCTSDMKFRGIRAAQGF